MTTCPHCNTPIDPATEVCPHCEKKVTPISSLEKIDGRLTGWQKFVIAVSIIILIAIGLFFQQGESNENKAAQAVFDIPAQELVHQTLAGTAIAGDYGLPVVNFDSNLAEGKLTLLFPGGPMPVRLAQELGSHLCTELARLYLNKGYTPRTVTVEIDCRGPKGSLIRYGNATWHGNFDKLTWTSAAQ